MFPIFIMAQASNYREYPPHEHLRKSVVCYWSHAVDVKNAGRIQPVYPDGCVDILWRNDDIPVVVGAMTRFRQSALVDGLRLIGVRLMPGQAGRLLGLPAKELTDLEIPLTDLTGRTAFARPLPGDDAKPTAALIRTVEERMIDLVKNARSETFDPWSAVAVNWFARHPAGRVVDLARLLGFSERQLNRRFVSGVGYGPRLFARILRFQRLLDLSERVADFRLADLALDAGFADQAHMNRECRELAGRTPAEILRNPGSALEMSDLFNTPAES